MKRFGIILAVILILGLSSSIGQARPLGQTVTNVCANQHTWAFGTYIVLDNYDLTLCGVPVGVTALVNVNLNSGGHNAQIAIDDTILTAGWDYISWLLTLNYSEIITDGNISQIRILAMGGDKVIVTATFTPLATSTPTVTSTPTATPLQQIVTVECLSGSYASAITWVNFSPIACGIPSNSRYVSWKMEATGTNIFFEEYDSFCSGSVINSMYSSVPYDYNYLFHTCLPYSDSLYSINFKFVSGSGNYKFVVSYVLFIYSSTATPTVTPTPTPTSTPTPAVSFLANPGYDFTYGPTPGYEPVNNSNYSVSYFPKNLLLPAAVTTTEGFFVPDISCNQPPAGGALCQNYDGDRVISPTRLVDLCNVGAVSIVQSYVVALEPACNGSQFRNAQLINFATGERVDCTSAMPKCWLVANDLDEVAMTVDLDNDVAGVDYRLRTYVLRGGSDDFLVIGLLSIFSTFFFVFLHANKTEAFGRGLIFFVCYLVYFVAGGSPTQVSRLYYFYLFFEAGFSLLWFARYKLFLAKVRK